MAERGVMVYGAKRIPVVEVKAEHHLAESGVRDGWYADDPSVPGSRMFYPADMFEFVPEPDGSGKEERHRTSAS